MGLAKQAFIEHQEEERREMRRERRRAESNLDSSEEYYSEDSWNEGSSDSEELGMSCCSSDQPTHEIDHDHCDKCDIDVEVHHTIIPGHKDEEDYGCPSCYTTLGTIMTSRIDIVIPLAKKDSPEVSEITNKTQGMALSKASAPLSPPPSSPIQSGDKKPEETWVEKINKEREAPEKPRGR